MKKIFLIVIILLTWIVIPLVSAELFLRLNPRFGYVYTSFHRLDNKTAPQAQKFIQLGYRPSSILGYEYIPGVKSIKGDINSYGLVGKEYELKKKKGVCRILVLGDSVAAQGWSCTFLEEKLNNNILSHTFEIWNSGTGSYDVRRYALYLKHKGLKYNPDMVIVFFNMNDFDADLNIYYRTSNGAMAYSFPLSEISKKYTVSPFLLKHSFFYRFIVLRLDRYLLNKKKMSGEDSYGQLGKYYLQMIKETCGENNLPLLIVIFPYFKPLEEYKNDQVQQYKIINKTIQDLKINHINLYDYLPVKDLKNLRDSKDDELHPSREAHRIVADILYDYMVNNYFRNETYKNIKLNREN